MSDLTHLTQKIMAERARQQTTAPAPSVDATAPPPPYQDDDDDADSDDDSDDDTPTHPINLTINAANQIHGHNNLVPTTPSPMMEASRFSTVLLQAITQLNNANALQSRKPRIKVNLTVNCGTTIVGDRNVIGNFGVKPKLPNVPVPAGATATAAATPNNAQLPTPVEPPEGGMRVGAAQAPKITQQQASMGAKRKAEDDGREGVGEEEAQKRAKLRVKIEDADERS